MEILNAYLSGFCYVFVIFILGMFKYNVRIYLMYITVLFALFWPFTFMIGLFYIVDDFFNKGK